MQKLIKRFMILLMPYILDTIVDEVKKAIDRLNDNDNDTDEKNKTIAK